MKKSQYEEDKEQEEPDSEENIFYQDFNYFYKDLVSCAFLFLNHYTNSPNLLTAYKRLTNSLWQMIEKNPINENSLIKLHYRVLESIKFSICNLPSESISNHDLMALLETIKIQWYRVIGIDFEAYINEDDNEDDDDEDEAGEGFIGLRIDVYFVMHEILSNIMKKLSDDQKTEMIHGVFQELYIVYLDDYFMKEMLTEIEEDILSSILYGLVELLQEITAEFLKEKLPWVKILENLIRYATYPDELIRHNSCYALGLFHEKLENHHDIFPEIIGYVTKTIECLEKAAEIKTHIDNAEDFNENTEVPASGIELQSGPAKNEEKNHEKEPSDAWTEEDMATDIWECLDNVYSAIGRMIKIYLGNNEFIKPHLIRKWLKYLPVKHDVEEGRDQHEILLEVLLKNWEEIVQMNEENYEDIIRIMGELCLESNEEIADIKIKKKIKKLCKAMKNYNNQEKFKSSFKALSNEAKKALEDCLNNIVLRPIINLLIFS